MTGDVVLWIELAFALGQIMLSILSFRRSLTRGTADHENKKTVFLSETLSVKPVVL